MISLSFHTHFTLFFSPYIYIYIYVYIILIEIPYTIIRATGLVSNTGSSDVVSSVLSNPRRLEVSQGNHWWWLIDRWWWLIDRWSWWWWLIDHDGDDLIDWLIDWLTIMMIIVVRLVMSVVCMDTLNDMVHSWWFYWYIVTSHTQVIC